MTAAPVAAPNLPSEELDDATKLAVRSHPGVWFDSFAWVEDREKQLRRADPSNSIQRQLFRIYCWCQDNGVPCNTIGLKSRKEGLSTGATALAYHHLSEHRAEGIFIGTENLISDTLTSMLRRYAERDAFPWGTTMRWRESTNSGTWSHGSKVSRETAMDSGAGRSGTIQVLVATEVAHWPSDGVRSADDTMLSILNSMPDIANLLRVVDSTANGATGWFYDTYQGAVTFEERKAGKRGNGWIRLFEPWHSNPLRRVMIDDTQRAQIQATLTSREQTGQVLYGWSEEQIEWRRQTLATKCKGDEKKFDQEYPESEDVAFLTSGNPKFNTLEVAKLLRVAEDAEMQRQMGSKLHGTLGHLREAGAGTHFMAVAEDAWLWLLEPPARGRRYLLFCDPMTGEQSKGALVRDRHACGILRDAYTDEEGRLHIPEVVAVLHDPEGCRWAMDVLAKRMAFLYRWFGKCLVVPEVNKAMDLIPLLRAEGVDHIYVRPVRPDHTNPSENQTAVGFLTSSATRNVWVNALEVAIRERQIGCLYPAAVRDWLTFIVNADGRSEAAPKKHDDWCAGIGIGLATIAGATLIPLHSQARPHIQQAASAPQPGGNPFGACG